MFAAGILALAAIFVLRAYGKRHHVLPTVATLPETAGLSCEQGLQAAQALTQRRALDRARLVYLWLVSRCRDSPVLPDALLDAGSLFGYLLHQPHEAQQVYEEFLRRFPNRPQAADATYHLAKLEIDAGDYTAAVAHLTELTQRYPDSTHEESAKFLAAKAAEMLQADRRSRQTASGRLGELVPNNVISLLALLTALGPSVIQTVSKTKKESGETRWVLTSVIIGLTLLNYVMNHADSARRDRVLMAKLDQLAGAAHAQGAP